MAAYITDPSSFIPLDKQIFGKRYIKYWQQTRQNLSTYEYWWQLFFRAAISRYKIEGLPEDVDQRYLNILLVVYGSFAITQLNGEGLPLYMAGNFATQGRSDIYNNPNAINIIAPNGFQRLRHANYYAEGGVLLPPDAVICWDNLARLPILPHIDRLAMRLAKMDQIIDQHVRAMAVPYIFAVEQGGEKNAQELYNRISSGQPAIYEYNTGIGTVPISVLQTMSTGSYCGDRLLNDQLKLISQMYTMLGIDSNAAAEKKERVQTAETLANNEQFLIQRASYSKARDQFTKKCEEVLGISPKFIWNVAHTSEDENVQGRLVDEHSNIL